MKKFLREFCVMTADFAGGFIVIFAVLLLVSCFIATEFLFFKLISVFVVLLLLVSTLVGFVLEAIDLVKKIKYRLTLWAWKRKYGPDQKQGR